MEQKQLADELRTLAEKLISLSFARTGISGFRRRMDNR